MLENKKNNIMLNVKDTYQQINDELLKTASYKETQYFTSIKDFHEDVPYLIIDPNGELYQQYLLESKKICIPFHPYCYNFLDLSHSETFNPLLDIKGTPPYLLKMLIKENSLYGEAQKCLLDAVIGLLTEYSIDYSKKENKPYSQILEITGGLCYASVFANIFELISLAEEIWTPTCGIALIPGIKLHENASKLEAIFENLRMFESKYQNCEISNIKKPDCLYKWETFNLLSISTQNDIVEDLLTMLYPYQKKELYYITSGNSFDLKNCFIENHRIFIIFDPNCIEQCQFVHLLLEHINMIFAEPIFHFTKTDLYNLIDEIDETTVSASNKNLETPYIQRQKEILTNIWESEEEVERRSIRCTEEDYKRFQNIINKQNYNHGKKLYAEAATFKMLLDALEEKYK